MKVIYEAFDGTQFNLKRACFEYEKAKSISLRRAAEPFTPVDISFDIAEVIFILDEKGAKSLFKTLRVWHYPVPEDNGLFYEIYYWNWRNHRWIGVISPEELVDELRAAEYEVK